MNTLKQPLIFFTHGFVATEIAFEEFTALLVENYGNTFLEAPIINMDKSHAPVKPKRKLAFDDEASEKDIDKQIGQLNVLASLNEEQAILCRLRLCGFDGASSIEEQSLRLVYIVRTISVLNEQKRPIILVGHSQGGLVNLLAATYLESQVDQLISISTPYRDVQSVKEAMTLLKSVNRLQPFLEKFFKRSLPNLTDEASLKLTSTALSYGDAKFSNWLKERFYAMSFPPRLDVICSIAGIFNGSVFNWRRAYDGFITVSEQQDIAYDGRHLIGPKPIPCMEKEKTPAANAYNRCFNCKECGLPEFNFRFLFNDFRNKISPDEIIFDILDGGFDALKDEAPTPGKENHSTYQIFHQTFSGGNDHGHVVKNVMAVEKVVEILVGENLLNINKTAA